MSVPTIDTAPGKQYNFRPEKIIISGQKTMTLFIGYDTNDPKKAAELYEKRTGYKPTVIVARPEFVLKSEHPLVRRSNNGAAAALLVTHLAYPDEIKDGIHATPTPEKLVGVSEELRRYNPHDQIPKFRQGRPCKSKSKCPHCGQTIENFDALGFWWGWQYGIEPPYWEELRLSVFRRDDYTCQKCHRRLPASDLRCHHLIPKETGGSDSAKNLQTLCGKCHPDEHPIYPEKD